MAADSEELTPDSFMKAQAPPPADLNPDSFMDDERRRQGASPRQLTPEVFMNTVNGTPGLLAAADQAAADRNSYVNNALQKLEDGTKMIWDHLNTPWPQALRNVLPDKLKSDAPPPSVRDVYSSFTGGLKDLVDTVMGHGTVDSIRATNKG